MNAHAAASRQVCVAMDNQGRHRANCAGRAMSGCRHEVGATGAAIRIEKSPKVPGANPVEKSPTVQKPFQLVTQSGHDAETGTPQRRQDRANSAATCRRSFAHQQQSPPCEQFLHSCDWVQDSMSNQDLGVTKITALNLISPIVESILNDFKAIFSSWPRSLLRLDFMTRPRVRSMVCRRRSSERK
jgi:hypothetical protein